MPDPDLSRSEYPIKTFDFVDGKVRDDIVAELRAERDRLRQAIRDHRAAIRDAGDIVVIWGRWRARKKRAADHRLWREGDR